MRLIYESVMFADINIIPLAEAMCIFDEITVKRVLFKVIFTVAVVIISKNVQKN